MNKTKERFINFRPLLIIALMLCMSVVFMVEIYSNLLFLIPAILVSIILTTFCLFKRKFVFLCFALFIYILGFGITAITIENYSKDFDKESCVVYGRVCDVVYSGYEGTYYLTLENVVVEIEDDKISLNGKTNATVYGVLENDITVGDVLSCKTKISNISLLEDGDINVNYYHDNVRYFCSLSYKNIKLKTGNPNIIEKLKFNSKNNLIGAMGEDIGGISYAVLFGDKSLIDYKTTTSFRESGVAHILAVSGLHVGFLFALIYFFLNKLPLNRWLKFLLLFVCLLAYCYICQFSPSVIRASIMCLCLIFTRLLGKQYDSLSSFSLAFIIIILFGPLFIFDVGFQMSFGAVLGSILVLKVINKFEIKNKFFKSIVSGISVSIATQLGILPIIANSFGYLATFSIIANIIVIPLFALFYPILCIANLFSLISSIFNFMLVIPYALMSTIVSISNFISSIPYSYIQIFGMGIWGSIAFYVALFTMGGFINLKGEIKVLSVMILFALSGLFLVINNIPYKFTTNNFVITADNYYYAKINTDNNSLYLIDIDTNNIENLTRELSKNKIRQIDGLIFINNLKFDSRDISKFAKDFNCKIYVPEGHTSVSNLLLVGCEVAEYTDTKLLYLNSGTMQTFTYKNGKIVEFKIDNKRFLITSGKFSNEDIIDIKSEIIYTVDLVAYDEESIVLNEEDIFNSNYHLYYGEECDIVI